jgi:Protein of unknown function (DUF3147)
MVKVNSSTLSRTTWYEYAVRFFFGGAITVAAGLIAKRYGPAVGGLFLAFPAIFPASATLIEKHEKERKASAGIRKTLRGLHAAALDARGAAMGCLGLATFAVAVWKLLPVWNGAVSLCVAILMWTIVSFAVWRFRKVLHVF